ncbi:Metallo-hydrolase/oxidoreductase [Aureobasidium sp. EXF-10727]|nr:Metallo-hydrolase/oxidoreductase [Aureobasidium sp. EXF-10727]
MASAQVPPSMKIPPSKNTVEVSIIDTTSFMSGFPASTFVEPDVPGFDTMNVGSYAYIIKHAPMENKHDTLLFDLGVRHDWENLPATFVAGIKAGGYGIHVEKDVATILADHGQDLNEVGAIIWSHWHFDHVGDPNTFPTTTDLIVGPGFRSNFIPSYPTVPASHLDERAWENRNLLEIDFSDARGLRIGGFDAYDFYGDGSFYLLNSPGHAIGHISALARTTAEPSTFMLLGGDIAHHCGEFRPSRYAPLPDFISPSPLSHRAGGCPGKLFLASHPKNCPDAPFFDPVRTGGWHHAAQQAKDSIDNLIIADAYDHIFPVMAHDCSLAGIVDFYPEKANDWMAKGWKKKSYWGFLRDFAVLNEDSIPIPQDCEEQVARALEHRKDSGVSGPR